MDALSLSGDVVLLRLDNGKANAIDEAMLDQIDAFVARVHEARAGVIVGYDRFFSGGLALPSLVDRARPEMQQFIERFCATMARLYASERPVVAAVNGHAVAGGCVLAMMADARVMAEGDFKIGLNEAQLGIGLPAIVLEVLRALVPSAALGPLAVEGQLVSPARALVLGLVDELAAPAAVEARALERARALGALPPDAFAHIKTALRRPVLETVARIERDDTVEWLDTWFSPVARERLAATVARLRK